MKTEETELLERTIANPLTPKAARQVARQMLDEQKSEADVICELLDKAVAKNSTDPAGSDRVVIYQRNPDSTDQRDKDTQTLARFAALINTCRRFELENVPLTFEQAENIMRLAQAGYLNQYVKRNV